MTTRRLAAILAADVVGFSKLIGEDEAGTLAALREIRRGIVNPVLAEHGGRIFKLMGDGMLAEFPSAVQALRAAIGIQEAMRQRNAGLSSGRSIDVRIGVHQGDVVVEGTDLLGDGINIAARLEALAEPGGICISARVHEDATGKIVLEAQDMGEQSLKNIARPVRAYRVSVISAQSGAREQTADRPALPLPDKPSLAVLPFQNISGDPEQEYFADGIVEEIITALSRVRSFFVIARNSSFTYKGRAVDLKQVGRELGVRYVLEGSVRKAAGRVRITAQLIDASTSNHIWSDRYDGSIEAIFDLQDRIAESVVGVIEPSITGAEMIRARTKPTENLDAYDLYLRALSLHYLGDRKASDDAVKLLHKALEIDPEFDLAKAQLAFNHHIRVDQGWGDAGDPAEGARLAREAGARARDNPTVLRLAGHALAYFVRDQDAGVNLIDRSLALNPNSAQAHGSAGWCRRYLEQLDEAISHFQKAMRLSPLDPERGYFLSGLAAAHNDRKEFEQALPLAQQAVQEMPSFVTSHQMLIRCLVGLGRLEAARLAGKRLLEVTPSYTLSHYRAIAPMRSPTILEESVEAQRQAGIPE
jgi:adenylate cyclase